MVIELHEVELSAYKVVERLHMFFLLCGLESESIGYVLQNFRDENEVGARSRARDLIGAKQPESFRCD